MGVVLFILHLVLPLANLVYDAKYSDSDGLGVELEYFLRMLQGFVSSYTSAGLVSLAFILFHRFSYRSFYCCEKPLRVKIDVIIQILFCRNRLDKSRSRQNSIHPDLKG